MSLQLGILHPGEMGSAIAASARNTADPVYWCSAGRSPATHHRATTQNLTAIPELRAFCDRCDVIIAVCPPHAALEQARAVIAAGFSGLYVEANAVAPATTRLIAGELQSAGISCVDGGIIGLPSLQPGGTWLYLSGPDAETAASCFAAGPVETKVLGNEIGQASALKMCYAAWNKGSTALLAAVLAGAEASGVRDALERHWDRSNPGFSHQSHARIASVARKAWRFSGEMQEIESLLRSTGVPADFFVGAARVYEALAALKDVDPAPAIDEVLNRIVQSETDGK